MSVPRLGARDRRALALGAVVVVPSLLFGLVVTPYVRTLSEVQAQVEVQRGLLERELNLIAEAGSYPEALDRVEAGLRSGSPRLFGRQDPLAATAALADYIGEQAGRSRVFVERSETREPEASGDHLVALRVEIQAAGDLQGILSFLRRLERGERLVRVERLAIEQARSYGADGEDVERLSLSATIHGYTLAPDRDAGDDSPGDASGEETGR